MKIRFQQWICLVAILILASMICLLLNHYDNKYTKSGVQGIDGILALSEEELQQNNIHYLIDGWAFYPGVLLTPDELAANADSYYMYYTSIGERTHFNSNDNDPHGCGTYVLTLILPWEGDYALELPEIYSAYKLYINGELILQVGDPEANTYNAQTQVQTVALNEGGTVTLILAVSDYSHFYSGLVYPPAFGTLSALSLTRTARLGLTLCLVVAALICAALALYMGLRLRRGNSLLFSLLCLITAIYTSSPLVHSVMALPIHPWYALEICGWYAMTFLVIVLQNRLCGISGLPRRISELTAGLFSIAALCYGLFSASLTTSLIHVFSTASTVFKLLSAAYLLAISLRTLQLGRLTHHDSAAPASLSHGNFSYNDSPEIQADRCRTNGSSPVCRVKNAHHGNSNTTHTVSTPQSEKQPLVSSILFYGSVFYAAMLIWDRILPDFEPVISGWFPEWGCGALILAIGITIWKELVSSYAYSIVFSEEYRQMKRQLAMQTEYSGQLKERAEETRHIIHDFRHHLRTVTELASQVTSTPETRKNQEELLHYLEEFPDAVTDRTGTSSISYCNRPAVDALLQYYHAAASRQDTRAQFALSIPDGITLSDVEWCSLLGNLLENALEACARQQEGAKEAAIATDINGNTFYLKIENTYDGQYRRQSGHFLSRKTEGVRLGVGLESVTDVVTKHGGSVHFYPEEAIFSVGITLPINTNPNK